MKSFFNIEIPKRNAKCSKEGEAFEPGAYYYSLVIEEDEQLLIRHDYCAACWAKILEDEGLLKDAVTHWKSIVPTKKDIKDLYANRDEKALALLKEAVKGLSEEDAQRAFVLSLYLARKKLIYLRKEVSSEDGHSLQLYEVAQTEEMIGVKKMALSSLQIEKVQKDIAQLLKYTVHDSKFVFRLRESSRGQ